METVIDEIRASGEDSSGITAGPDDVADEEPKVALEDVEAQNILAERRSKTLRRGLSEAREESRRNAEELQRALESLERLSDPARRLREGIALFNESEHARTVASISKAFGLQGSRGTGGHGSRETNAHVPLGRHGLAALRLRPHRRGRRTQGLPHGYG